MATASATVWLLGVGAAHSAAAGTEDRLRLEKEQLCVVVDEKAPPAERRAAAILVAEVRRRTGIEVAIGGRQTTKFVLLAGTAQSSAEIASYVGQHPDAAKLETDGFYLATAPDEKGRLYVVGQSPSGVVAGVGKLLRLGRYAEGVLELPKLTQSDHPRMPVRGMYFATHFHNFYHIAPPEEVDRIIEELALWGCNSLSVWFDTSHFKSFQDPMAQTQLARLNRFGATAHRLGMQFGLTFVPNEIYNSDAASPRHLRADAGDTRGTVRATSLCPSKPEALALLGKSNAEMLDAFGPVDFVWAWPWDSGGCTCKQCNPWGGKGFLLVSAQLARLYHERCPQGKVWVSTWCFDLFGSVRGEHDGFFTYVREKQPAWAGLITGTYAGDGIQRRILHERPYPERYPVTSFPEISMHMHPWGGYGIDPLPEYNTRIAKELLPYTVGGWPYSEGIYEDLNKFFWVQSYWNPQRTTDDIHAEYATYYLGPEFAVDAVRLFRLMEKTNKPRRTSVRLTNTAEVDESWALAQKIDSRLVAWAKTSWRWRIIHIRAAIDRIAKNMRGFYAAPEDLSALKPLHTELASTYHWDYSKDGPEGWVFHLPPLPDPRDLSYLRPVTVSSTLRDYENSSANLVDGDFGGGNSSSFWVQDATKEKTAWACVDLGKSAHVEEVRLGFRNLGGKYAFVPSSLSYEVSDDGRTFTPAGASTKVPKEGDEVANTASLPGTSPATRPWAYAIGKLARYLRVNLGVSQRKQPPFAGTLELTEIQVLGKREGEPARGGGRP
jgi:hypothetical protein